MSKVRGLRTPARSAGAASPVRGSTTASHSFIMSPSSSLPLRFMAFSSMAISKSPEIR